MKCQLLFLLCAIALLSACTTLENRRDLYRAPDQGYEEWSPHPPPTRLPAMAPGTPVTSGTTREQHGVITFPEENLPKNGQ